MAGKLMGVQAAVAGGLGVTVPGEERAADLVAPFVAFLASSTALALVV